MSKLFGVGIYMYNMSFVYILQESLCRMLGSLAKALVKFTLITWHAMGQRKGWRTAHTLPLENSTVEPLTQMSGSSVQVCTYVHCTCVHVYHIAENIGVELNLAD